MFKYSVKSNIQHRAKYIFNTTRGKKYNLFMGEGKYFDPTALVHFSMSDELKEVQLNGFMFPAKMFNIELVS